MDQYTSIILAALGSSGLTFLVKVFVDKKRRGLDFIGARDDQTAKWRDNALMLSENIVTLNMEKASEKIKANLAEIELQNCREKLGDCDCP